MLVLGQIIITKKPLNILLPLKTEYLYILPVFYSANTNFMRHFTWALRHINTMIFIKLAESAD